MALGWRKEYIRYKQVFLNILGLYKQKEDLRIFLEIILSLSTISIFTAFALRPTILTILELTKGLKTKEQIRVTLTQKIENLEIAQDILMSEEFNIASLNLALPDLPKPETLAKQIEGASSKNSVKVSSLSVEETTLLGKELPKKTSSELSALPENAAGLSFSLSVSGSYTSLLSFVKDLENLKTPFKLDSLNLNLIETDEGKSLVGVISGRAVYYQQN